ncbi:MAG: NTP transferase domain-containing protein [Acidobacteriota bacterium]
MNAYILIGGSSLRMGQSKVAMFLDRVAAAARGAFDDVFAVQRAGGEGAGGVATIFESPHGQQAPVFGVARALAHANARCFILGVDYPLITAALLLRLRARFESSDALLMAPRSRGKLQMLCAGYDAALLPRIEQRIAEGRLDLRDLVTEVVDEESYELMNVNTPEEWEEARRLYEA